MLKPRITCHPGRPRPFKVTSARGRSRSYGTMDRAIAAVVVMTSPADRRPIPRPEVVDVPQGVYRITARVSNLTGQAVTLRRDVTARGRGPALTAFADTVANSGRTVDKVLSVRHLSRRDPLDRAAKTKRTKGNLSARRRRQRGAAETRVLRNAGLSETMATIALTAAAGRPRIAK